MLVDEAVHHLRVSGVHFQDHAVPVEAGDVGVQEDAGLDHFVRGFIVYTQDSSFKPTAQSGRVTAGSLRPATHRCWGPGLWNKRQVLA